HRAALNAVLVFKGAFGIDIAFEITVVPGVGIDDAADGAVFLRHLGLDAAPGVAVFGDDDLAFYRDAHSLESFVVFGDTVVDEYEFARDVAVGGKTVVGRQLFPGLVAGSVF